MTRRLLGLVLALAMVVVACAGRGGDGLSRSEQRLADSVAQGLLDAPGTPFDEDSARCFAERLVADLGSERVRALDALASDDPSALLAALDEREAELFADGILTCVDDFLEEFVDGLAFGAGVSRSSAECVAAALEPTGFIHDVVIAAFRDGHDEALFDEAMEATIEAHLPAFLAAAMGCFTPEELAAVDDDDPGPGSPTGARQVSVFALRVGDCFDDPPNTDQIGTVPVVPCSEPHDNEIYFMFDLPDGPFPGEDEVFWLADEGCLAEFEPFVGTDYWDSDLDFFAIYPTMRSWARGDRAVICALYALDLSKLEGTMRDSGR